MKKYGDLCHIYEIADAGEAGKDLETEPVKDTDHQPPTAELNFTATMKVKAAGELLSAAKNAEPSSSHSIPGMKR